MPHQKPLDHISVPAIEALVAGLLQELAARRTIIIGDFSPSLSWAVVEGANIVGQGNLPMGSDYVLCDLASVLQISFDEAKALMRETMHPIRERKLLPERPAVDVGEIAVVRIIEIFQKVKETLLRSQWLPDNEAKIILASPMWEVDNFGKLAVMIFGHSVQNASDFMIQEATKKWSINSGKGSCESVRRAPPFV